MLIEALRGEAVSLVNSATGGVASRQRRRSRVASSVALAATTALGAALLLGGGSSAARAQTINTGAQRDFAFKVGIFSPSKKEVRTASATYIPMIEADYNIQKYPENHFNSIVSVGYIEHTGYRMIPITVSQIYRDPDNAAGVDYYYGLGVGLYETRLNISGTSDRVKGLFGGFIVAGLDLTRTVFVEGKYHLIQRYDEKNVSGFQAGVGFRF